MSAVRAVVLTDTEGRIVLHADGSERLVPARFVFLPDGRGGAAGAAAVDAEPVGGEQRWGTVLPLPEREEQAP